MLAAYASSCQALKPPSKYGMCSESVASTGLAMRLDIAAKFMEVGVGGLLQALRTPKRVAGFH